MTSLAILGAGGHGRVVADSAEATKKWTDIVFFDDSWPNIDQSGGWPVLGDATQLLKSAQKFDNVIVAIGTNSVRLNRSLALLDAGAALATVIHPRAIVSPYANVGAGSAILAGAILNIGARLGTACIINTGATIDHDCVLADGVHVSPGAHLSGNVSVGSCTWIGTSTGVRQQTAIGSNVVIGVGSAVVNNLPDNVIAVGVPAKPKSRT